MHSAAALVSGTEQQAADTGTLVTGLSVVENRSGIVPTGYHIVVLPEQVAEKTGGGIFLPDERRERMQAVTTTATVVAVAPLAFTYNDKAGDPPRSGWKGLMAYPGAAVVLAKAAGIEIEGRDGLKYRIINDKDVIAFWEPEHA